MQFKFGGRLQTGRVIEDRGHIASSGGQLLRVRIESADPDDAREIEVSVNDLVAPIAGTATSRAAAAR